MKLVVAATPKVAIPTIDQLRNSHDLIIVTQPDKSAGRGQHVRPTEVSDAYPEALKPNSEAELIEILQGQDLLITIGYGRILTSKGLSIPKYGCVNLHFSLLPRWRGAAPVQRALEAGDKETGVTVFQMDEGVDTGPIWSQLPFTIPHGADSTSLFESLSTLGVDAISSALNLISTGAEPKPQKGEVTTAKKVEKRECQIYWQEEAERIERKVRAFAANPGVTTSFRGQTMKIHAVRISDKKLPIGQIDSDGCVGTSSSALQILELTPAGKKRMSIRDWLNGAKPQTGESFE